PHASFILAPSRTLSPVLLSPLPSSFFFSCSGDHRDLHSFPTRRSSDLEKASFCVIAQDQIVPEEYTTYFRSVIVFGRIRVMEEEDRKSTRLNSSHVSISYAVFCLKKKKKNNRRYKSHKDKSSRLYNRHL